MAPRVGTANHPNYGIMAIMTETSSNAIRPRLYSGMQPSAESLHLGNYLGALARWPELTNDYDSLFCVVDQHAITVDHDPEALARRTRFVAATYIAAGVDPTKAIIYVQSHVPQHAQLGWILQCITGFGELSRMTQFKDKSGKLGTDQTRAGLFAYPSLMAADILLFDTNAVPVGDDQKQHLELTRDLAQRFNSRFGDTFTIPEPLIAKTGARIMDLQNPHAKMSKSAESPAGLIDLRDEPKVWTKRIKSAVTDAGTEVTYDRESKPGVANLIDLHALLSGKSTEDVVNDFEGKMYGHLKVSLAELVVERLTPIRERFLELTSDPAEIDKILADGALRARERAERTMQRVNDRIGFAPFSS